jgi:hypothetical protein
MLRTLPGRHLIQYAQDAVASGCQLTNWVYKNNQCFGFLTSIDSEQEFTGHGEAVSVLSEIKDFGDPEQVKQAFELNGFELVSFADLSRFLRI